MRSGKKNRMRFAGLSRVFEPIFLKGVAVEIDGAPAPVEMIDVTIGEVGDVEFARQSQLIVGGTIPEGAEALTFAWDASFGQIVFRALNEDRSGYVALLQGAERSEPVAIARSWTAAFIDHVGIGFAQFLPFGFDHVLFVVGLFLLSTQLRPLLTQVVSFTLAHSIALAVGALGLVNVPGEVVGPLLALSVVYVGVENILTTTLSPWRPIVVFVFGLFHGLAFAGGFAEHGAAAGQVASALIGFNIGVELGQLAVILACVLAVGFWFGRKPWYRQAVIIPGSVIVSLVGLYWFVGADDPLISGRVRRKRF